MTRTAKMKPVKAWGGFLGDRLDYWAVPLHGGGQLDFPAIFKTKAAGETRYVDVRRVQITELHPEQRRRKL